MGKFKVGDKARLNSARLNFKIGEIVEIVETDFADEQIPYRVRIENDMFWVRNEDLKKVNTKKQRIEALEKRVEMVDEIIRDVRGDTYHEVEAIKKEVAELRKVMESYFKIPVAPSTDDKEVNKWQRYTL